VSAFAARRDHRRRESEVRGYGKPGVSLFLQFSLALRRRATSARSPSAKGRVRLRYQVSEPTAVAGSLPARLPDRSADRPASSRRPRPTVRPLPRENGRVPRRRPRRRRDLRSQPHPAPVPGRARVVRRIEPVVLPPQTLPPHHGPLPRHELLGLGLRYCCAAPRPSARRYVCPLSRQKAWTTLVMYPASTHTCCGFISCSAPAAHLSASRR